MTEDVFIVAGLQGRPWHLGTETETDPALCGARPNDRIGWAYGNYHPGNLARVTCKRCLARMSQDAPQGHEKGPVSEFQASQVSEGQDGPSQARGAFTGREEASVQTGQDVTSCVHNGPVTNTAPTDEESTMSAPTPQAALAEAQAKHEQALALVKSGDIIAAQASIIQELAILVDIAAFVKISPMTLEDGAIVDYISIRELVADAAAQVGVDLEA